MNIYETPPSEETLAELFRLLAQPNRLQMLLVIGEGEACVCHLEAALGLRQAYISQQLMSLRDAGMVTTLRDGRNIFYRLSDPRLLDLIAQAAALLNAPDLAKTCRWKPPLENCPCPHCAGQRGATPAQVQNICC